MAEEDLKGAAATWILGSHQERHDEARDKLMSAASRVWPKAEAFARLEMQDSSLAGDSSIVWDIWEASLQSVLKTLNRTMRVRPVEDLDAYLFGVFCHRLRRRLAQERRIEFVTPSPGVLDSKAAEGWGSARDLEDRILLQKIISEMDDWMKDVLVQRVIDRVRWKDVGSACGLTEAEANKRFLYRVKKLRERLLGAKERGASGS
jgi:DNA-directed RNA polymerase specialized sigma24 family protein